MLIFVDESGIHKLVDKSTFVLVYVEIDSYSKIEKAISKVEKRLKINNFHWSETSWPLKEEFIKVVLGLDFKVKIAVIKNPVNPAQEMERVLSHMMIEHNIKNVFIDGKKPKWYERKIKKILRDKGVSVKKLKTVNDATNAGIKVADLVAGLSRWHFDGKQTDKIDKYYKLLNKKIIILIE
jgi:hypothetical protein